MNASELIELFNAGKKTHNEYGIHVKFVVLIGERRERIQVSKTSECTYEVWGPKSVTGGRPMVARLVNGCVAYGGEWLSAVTVQ